MARALAGSLSEGLRPYVAPGEGQPALTDIDLGDLYIDPRGKGRLFIAKQKTLAEWYEMMSRLRDLLFRVLALKDYHLLGLTKDKVYLHRYLAQKLDILADYYIIQDWGLL